jgi:copper(I)-binding protein
MTLTTVHARKKYSLAVGLAAVLLLSAVPAVSAQAADISVSNATAHVMEDSVNGRRIEVYMNIENSGAARDRLYAVRSKLSRKTVLAVVQDDGHAMGGSGHGASGHSEAAMHMQSAVLDVPAGEVTTFQHGKSHIMLMEPKEALAVGATFPVTLFFERAGRISVEVTIVTEDMGH